MSRKSSTPRQHRPDEGLGRSRGGLTCKIHLAGEAGLCPLALLITHVAGPFARDDHHAALVRQQQVTGVNSHIAQGDRLAGRPLPQPAAGGRRHLSAGIDREAERTGLPDIPAGAVGDDAANPAEGGADADDAAPGGDVGAAAVGDDEDVMETGLGDRAGEDVCAAVLASQGLELDRLREPDHLRPAPHGPQTALPRRKAADVECVKHSSVSPPWSGMPLVGVASGGCWGWRVWFQSPWKRWRVMGRAAISSSLTWMPVGYWPVSS